jgi:hypothetical protein
VSAPSKPHRPGIAYGYLPADQAAEGTKMELYFFGQC